MNAVTRAKTTFFSRKSNFDLDLRPTMLKCEVEQDVVKALECCKSNSKNSNYDPELNPTNRTRKHAGGIVIPSICVK